MSEAKNEASELMPLLSGSSGYISTPFNLEEILRACPHLLAKWEAHPFILNINEGGKVVVVYV